MELKEILKLRRSVRKFTQQQPSQEVIDRLLEMTFTAPSSRNSRSTELMIITESEKIARMAQMRDYGSGFLSNAPLVIVVMGDHEASDLHLVNSSISATTLQLACVDEGLASCWVHIEGRPHLKDQPNGKTAEEFLREFLPIPTRCTPLCAIAIGYAERQPGDLPAFDPTTKVIRL